MSILTNRSLEDVVLLAANELESDLIKNRPMTIESDSKKSMRDTYGVELFQNSEKKVEHEIEVDQLFRTKKKQEQQIVETKLLFQNEGSYTIINTKQETSIPTLVYILAAFILAAIAIKLALIDWKGIRHEKKSNDDD